MIAKDPTPLIESKFKNRRSGTADVDILKSHNEYVPKIPKQKYQKSAVLLANKMTEELVPLSEADFS